MIRAPEGAWSLAVGTVRRTVPLCRSSFKSSLGKFKVKKFPNLQVREFLVPVTGLEPVRYCYRGILSPLRLPIPPHRQTTDVLYTFISGLSRFFVPKIFYTFFVIFCHTVIIFLSLVRQILKIFKAVNQKFFHFILLKLHINVCQA